MVYVAINVASKIVNHAVMIKRASKTKSADNLWVAVRQHNEDEPKRNDATKRSSVGDHDMR